MKPRKIEVDFERIWDALDGKRRELGWTWGKVCELLEVKDIQISAMKWRGQGIHPHTLAAAMVWLDRDLRDFIR